MTYLHRVLPPRLTKRFTEKFDTILRDGLELLLQARLGAQARERREALRARWWRQAKLPSKYGGMHLRSGLSTAAAQFTTSVIFTEKSVLEIAGTYNAREVIERDAKLALEEALGAEVTPFFKPRAG